MRGGSNAFLRIGALGEVANLFALIAINALGPRWLGAEYYGDYSLILGSALLPIALINEPLVLRLLTRPLPRLAITCAKHLGMTLPAVALTSILSGLSPAGGASAVAFAAAYVLLSVVSHYGYKVSDSSIYAKIAGASAVAGLFSMWWGSSRANAGEIASFVHSGSLLIVGLIAMAWWLRREESFVEAPSGRNRAGTFYYAVPAILTGASQWLLVLSAGRYAGSEAAAIVRVATSLIGIPGTVVPISGALLYSAGLMSSSRNRTNMRVLLIAASLGCLVAAAVGMLRWPIIAFLGSGAFQQLDPLFPLLLGGGVGLLVVKVGWVDSVARLWTPEVRASRAIPLVAASFLPATVGRASPVGGLVTLVAIYLGAGFVVGASIVRAGLHRG